MGCAELVLPLFSTNYHRQPAGSGRGAGAGGLGWAGSGGGEGPVLRLLPGATLLSLSRWPALGLQAIRALTDAAGVRRRLDWGTSANGLHAGHSRNGSEP